MFGAFLAGLAGFAWAISCTAGYHFGTTLIAVFSVYAAILLAYACWRRIVQRLRVARARKASEANRG